MPFTPRALSSRVLSPEELKTDRKQALRHGTCALGNRALYLGGHTWLSCLWYIPLERVERVYKRLAVSKGFTEPNKPYLTLAYLVAVYDGGREKTCRFQHEEDLDLLLAAVRSRTRIPVGKK